MTEQSDKPALEYIAPEREGIDRYAQSVCEQLAERYNDPVYREGEVVHGLAEFLRLAGTIQARYFNRSGVFDNSSGEG